jgi:hypothetical protein
MSAMWDELSEHIVRRKDRPWPGYPGWLRVDCGCCAGIKWGGYTPQDCERCGGSGLIAVHKKSRVIADYPGGPLRGRL